MIYPNLKIHPHFFQRFWQRLGIGLNDASSVNGVIKRIQNESWHMADIGNRELRLFRIKKKFYVGVIGKSDELVITIYHPNHEKRELAFYTFEHADHSKTDKKTIHRYSAWRKNLLRHNGWHVNVDPRLYVFKTIALWGNHTASAHWDGEKWIGTEGEVHEPIYVWGWKNE